MLEVPELPPSAAATLRRASLKLRYEDVAQDGRAKLTLLPAALGDACWRGSFELAPIATALRADGIVPILRRFVIRGTDAPLSVVHPLTAEGRWTMASSAGGRRRFLLDMRLDLTGPRDRTYGPKPDRAGEIEAVGSVFAEHVLTRPFAPRERRRVESLPDLTPLPERPWIPFDSLGESFRATGASWSDRHRFALGHTDSNQHVNSLVYPALFEQAAVRLGEGEGVRNDTMLRAIDIIWRKPSFAGDDVVVETRAIASSEIASSETGTFGALATLRGVNEDGSLETRPRCRALLWLG